MFYFRWATNNTDRMVYTMDPLDFTRVGAETVIFFWVPHLKRLAEVWQPETPQPGPPDLLRDFMVYNRRRRGAVDVLSGYVRAKMVRLIHQEFDCNPRKDAATRLRKLFKAEIRRATELYARANANSKGHTDPIFFFCNNSKLDRLYKYADCMPEPWDTRLEGVRRINNRPADSLLDN